MQELLVSVSSTNLGNYRMQQQIVQKWGDNKIHGDQDVWRNVNYKVSETCLDACRESMKPV